MSFAKEFYESRVKENTNKVNKLKSKINIVGWSRLAVVILAGLIDYFLYKQDNIKLPFMS